MKLKGPSRFVVDDAPRGLERRQRQRVHAGDAGVVDQHVDARRRGCDSSVEELIDFVLDRHVHATVRIIRVGQGARRAAAADDLVALARVVLRQVQADAPRGARDDDSPHVVPSYSRATRPM